MYPSGSQTQIETKNPRVNLLVSKWQQVWLLALERRRKLNDALDRLEEVRNSDSRLHVVSPVFAALLKSMAFSPLRKFLSSDCYFSSETNTRTVSVSIRGSSMGFGPREPKSRKHVPLISEKDFLTWRVCCWFHLTNTTGPICTLWRKVSVLYGVECENVRRPGKWG